MPKLYSGNTGAFGSLLTGFGHITFRMSVRPCLLASEMVMLLQVVSFYWLGTDLPAHLRKIHHMHGLRGSPAGKETKQQRMPHDEPRKRHDEVKGATPNALSPNLQPRETSQALDFSNGCALWTSATRQHICSAQPLEAPRCRFAWCQFNVSRLPSAVVQCKSEGACQLHRNAGRHILQASPYPEWVGIPRARRGSTHHAQGEFFCYKPFCYALCKHRRSANVLGCVCRVFHEGDLNPEVRK